MTEIYRHLAEHTPDQIWLKPYPIRYAGVGFEARMTVVRLADGRLLLHSPAPLDDPTREEIARLGEVGFIIGPGNFHHINIPACQTAFPSAQTWICPGIEVKQPRLRFDGILGDRPPEAWVGELDQVLVRGNRMINEVAFFHRPSRTLILVDIIENIGDSTPNVSWGLKLWWVLVTRMWNKAKPAPEYALGWKDKVAARMSLERILSWDFERIIIAHGDLIERDAKDVARSAWRGILAAR